VAPDPDKMFLSDPQGAVPGDSPWDIVPLPGGTGADPRTSLPIVARVHTTTVTLFQPPFCSGPLSCFLDTCAVAEPG
jgi:hypothetical protein